MQRETKEIVTASGKKIVIKTYLTGREVIAAIKDKGETPNKFEVSQDVMKAAVVSFEGKTEGAFDAILDLPNAEYSEVATAIKEVVGGNFQKAK